MTQPKIYLRVRILTQLRADQPSAISMADLGKRLGLDRAKSDKLLWLQLKLLREDAFIERSGLVRYYRYSITQAGLTHLADIDAGKIASHMRAPGEQHRSAQYLARRAERQETKRQAAAKVRAFKAWARDEQRAQIPELTDADLTMKPADDRNIIRSVAQPGQAPDRPVASVWHLGLLAQQACEGRNCVPNRPKSEFEATAAARPASAFKGLPATGG